MALFAPGVAEGINASMAQQHQYGIDAQMAQQRKQQMDYQAWQIEQQRMQQANQLRINQAMQAPPQAPMPGQPSVPMQPPGQQMPGMQGAPQASPPIPPYRTVAGGQQQPPQAQQQPQGGPPPVSQIPPPPPGVTREQVQQRLEQAGVPWDMIQQQLDLFDKRQGVQATQQKQALEMQEIQKRLAAPTPLHAPPTRNVLQGREEAQMEMQPDGTWKQIGQGPRFAKAAVAPGSGVPASSDFSKLSEKDQRTVDFYAKQSLGGDNSWQVGLARGKVGQQLIQRVKDRIPELAEQTGQSAQDVAGTKAEMGALTKTLNDRVKYSTAVEQLQGTLTKQADLVESLIAKGASGSGSPVLNKWLQAGRKATGDPDVRAFNAAITGLSREHQRVLTSPLSNAQLHASAADTADKLINTADTPEAIRATIKVMRTEAANGKKQAQETVNEVKQRIAGLGKGKSAEAGAQPYSDADKEARYQAWKAKNAK